VANLFLNTTDFSGIVVPLFLRWSRGLISEYIPKTYKISILNCIADLNENSYDKRLHARQFNTKIAILLSGV